MKLEEIKLGLKVRDVITGLEGILTSITESLSGTVQVGIQPRGDGDKIAESWCIDYQSVDVIDEGVSARLPAIDDTVVVQLGDEVEDLVSGHRGMTTRKIIFVNGCVHFTVTGKINKDKRALEENLDHKTLKVIGVGLSKRAPEPAKKTKTGGPMTRAPRL